MQFCLHSLDILGSFEKLMLFREDLRKQNSFNGIENGLNCLESMFRHAWRSNAYKLLAVKGLKPNCVLNFAMFY